jgi:NAD(P)-dependent dehydrogenase (short-subunit alcohol dehydrogenase family)
LLFEKISKKNGRIINHSSLAHKYPNVFDFENLFSSEKYSPWTQYGVSKAANLLFTYELNNRLKNSEENKNIIAVAVHPGYTATNLQVFFFSFNFNLLFLSMILLFEVYFKHNIL